MFEDKFSFYTFIDQLNLSDGINVFIGEENIVKFLSQYSIIAKKVRIDGQV